MLPMFDLVQPVEVGLWLHPVGLQSYQPAAWGLPGLCCRKKDRSNHTAGHSRLGVCSIRTAQGAEGG